MAAPSQVVILAFNASNQLAVRQAGTRLGLAFVGADAAMATARLEGCFKEHTPPAEYFSCKAGALGYQVSFAQVQAAPLDPEVIFLSLAELDTRRPALAPSLAAVLDGLEPHLIAIPYLHLGENEYIYKFRVERDRNRDIYQQDDAARALYQSRLCEAIKTLA
ncbi:MAG: 4-hydroxy-3-methylbut-2-enyl diphosphate reductase, partial [Oleiharenicola lentus]